MQYPLHLLNLTSVRDFDAKIDKDEALSVLDPRRFRANIIGGSLLTLRGPPLESTAPVSPLFTWCPAATLAPQ